MSNTYRGNNPSHRGNDQPRYANYRTPSPNFRGNSPGPRHSWRTPTYNPRYGMTRAQGPSSGNQDAFFCVDYSPSPNQNQRRYSGHFEARTPFDRKGWRFGNNRSFDSTPYNNRRRSNYNSADNQTIAVYVHESMLEDPWKDLEDKILQDNKKNKPEESSQ